MNATTAPVVLAAFEDPDEVLEFAISIGLYVFVVLPLAMAPCVWRRLARFALDARDKDRDEAAPPDDAPGADPTPLLDGDAASDAGWGTDEKDPGVDVSSDEKGPCV